MTSFMFLLDFQLASKTFKIKRMFMHENQIHDKNTNLYY